MRHLLLVSLMLAAFTVSYGQTSKAPSDFSGKWRLNRQASDIPGFDFDTKENTWMEITLQSPTLTVVTKERNGISITDTNRQIYYTDGRGDTNFGSDGQAILTTTKFDGKKMVVKQDKNKSGSEMVEEWSLSGDGNRLTRKIIIKTKTSMSFQVNGRETRREDHTDKQTLIFAFDRFD